MIRLSPMKIVARIVVDLLRKSAVLRTPNIVPMDAPPNEPANPPPLLACIKTTTMSRMLTMISRVIKSKNITLLVFNCDKSPKDTELAQKRQSALLVDHFKPQHFAVEVVTLNVIAVEVEIVSEA